LFLELLGFGAEIIAKELLSSMEAVNALVPALRLIVPK